MYRRHRYMWVAGTHKHHRCPVHWVKYGGSSSGGGSAGGGGGHH
jgi:hypothetical protein